MLFCNRPILAVQMTGLQRCILQNLSGIHSYGGDIESRESGDMKRIKLCDVEPYADRFDRAFESPAKRFLLCSPKSSSRVAPMHPNKVPFRKSNHCFKRPQVNLLQLHPASRERFHGHAQIAWHDACVTQEDGARNQSCTLFEGTISSCFDVLPEGR